MAKQVTKMTAEAGKPAVIEYEFSGTAIIEVPIAPALSSVEYATRSIELTLTPEQAQWVKRLWKALDERGAKLRDGRYVTRPGNALQWVIEQGMASES